MNTAGAVARESRLFAISDLHVDFAANAQWVRSLSTQEYTADVLLVAGDVAHQPNCLNAALSALRERFSQVFFVPGNHDLWVHGACTSLDKWDLVRTWCRNIGVQTEPGWAGDIWVVPLLSWYDASLDGLTSPRALESWADFRYCRWPAGVECPATYFAAANHDRLRPAGARVVTLSHFLPRIDLLPPPAVLRFAALPAVAGSVRLEAQIRALGAQIHVFGHSHIRRDVILDGIRYVQHCLGYPRERHGRHFRLEPIDPGAHPNGSTGPRTRYS